MESENTCCVCLDVIKKEVETACGHRFCVKCLFLWVFECVNDDDMEVICPLCRRALKLCHLKWKPVKKDVEIKEKL